MKKIKANLHMHSLYSDGSQWPAEMAIRGKMAGFEMVALTDHDSMEGVDEFLECCEKYGIDGVAATEIDCKEKKIDFDMELLAYFPDGNYEEVRNFLRERLKNREKLVIKLIENGKKFFNNDIISFDDFRNFKLGLSNEIMEGKLFSYIKYNLFQYFKFRKVLSEDVSYKEFKNEYYCEEKLGNLDEEKPILVDLVKMVEENNGYSVLPHPPWILDGFDWSEKFIKDNLEKFSKIFDYCKSIGIWGIEMNYYREETEMINKILGRLAKDYGFHLTWGSDCHGRGSEFCNLEKYFGYFEGFKR